MAYSLGQFDAAFVEVGVDLGFGQLNRFGIGMGLCCILFQVSKLGLNGVKFVAVIVGWRLRMLIADSNPQHQQPQEEKQRSAQLHRSAASAAGLVTVCTCGWSSVPEITYDRPPECCIRRSRLRS